MLLRARRSDTRYLARECVMAPTTYGTKSNLVELEWNVRGDVPRVHLLFTANARIIAATAVYESGRRDLNTGASMRGPRSVLHHCSK